MTDEGEGRPPVQVTPGQAAVAIVSVTAGLVLIAWIMSSADVTVSGAPGGSAGRKALEPTERLDPKARIEGASGEMPEAPPPAPPPSPPTMELEVEVDSCSSARDYVTVEGYVRNSGTTAVHFVTVELRYEGEDGQVVDTGTTYAVGSEVLRPGDSSRYEGMSRAEGVRRCRAALHDWRVVE